MLANRTYAIAGAKGGVGKTTTSINVAAAAAAAGHATVVVELDLAMANAVDVLDLSVDLDSVPTLHDVLTDDTPVESAVHPAPGGIDILPSGTSLTGYATADVAGLDDVVETLRWSHDVVLLDTPAGVGEAVRRAVGLADGTVLVSTPRVAAVRNADSTLDLVAGAGGTPAGLVLTRSGTGAAPPPAHLAEFLDLDLLGHVPDDPAVPHAQDEGEPVVQVSPDSEAARAYGTVARALLEEGPPAHAVGGDADVTLGTAAERNGPAEPDGESGPDGSGRASVTDSLRSLLGL